MPTHFFFFQAYAIIVFYINIYAKLNIFIHNKCLLKSRKNKYFNRVYYFIFLSFIKIYLLIYFDLEISISLYYMIFFILNLTYLKKCVLMYTSKKNLIHY